MSGHKVCGRIEPLFQAVAARFPRGLPAGGVAVLLLVTAVFIALPPAIGPQPAYGFFGGAGSPRFVSLPWGLTHLLLDGLLIAAYSAFLFHLIHALMRDLSAEGRAWADLAGCAALAFAVLLALADGLENCLLLLLNLFSWPGPPVWALAARIKIGLAALTLLATAWQMLFWFYSPQRLALRRGVAALVWRSKFTWLMLAGFALLLAFMDQTRDVAIRLAEGMLDDNWGKKPIAMFLLSFPAIFLFGLASWLWPRLLGLMGHDGGIPAGTPGLSAFAKWWARLLGLFPFLATALLFAKSGAEAAASSNIRLASAIALTGLLYVFAAKLFLSLVAFRRGLRPERMLTRFFPALAGKPKQSGGQVQYHNDPSRRTLKDVRGDAPVIYWLLWGSMIMMFAIVVMGYKGLGALNQILFGLGFISLLLGLLGFWSHRHMLPYSLALIVWVGVLGFMGWSENHLIRTLDAPPAIRPALIPAWQAWLDARKEEIRNLPDDQVYPVFLVSAEGGGIRAAYWTASTLMQSGKDFADHAFSLSAVSGGSVGAASYVACLEKTGHTSVASRFDKAAGQACLDDFLTQDYLSPALGKLLSTDLLAKLLPSAWLCRQFDILCKDRAAAFEQEFENGGLALMNGPFAAGGTRRAHLPRLFLNATLVENGKLVIASDVRITQDYFADSVDQLDMLGRDMRLSTAAHNSARFTYVNAVGTLRDVKLKDWHVADGGYADNSGARTSLHILRGLRRCLETECKFGNDQEMLRRKLRPVLVQIGNEPSRYTPGIRCARPAPDSTTNSHAADITAYAGLVSPPLAVYYAWNRHRWEDIDEVKEEAGQWKDLGPGMPAPLFCDVQLIKDGRLYPLGWVLSRQASSGMRNQAEELGAALDSKLAKEISTR